MVVTSMELNLGKGMPSFPADLAPQGPMQVHFANDVANGHGVNLPVKCWQEACAEAQLPLYGNRLQLAYQNDKVLGRQCSNLTHPKGSSAEQRFQETDIGYRKRSSQLRRPGRLIFAK